MNPVRKAAVIGLLEWTKRNRPDVRALATLSKQDFMELVTEFESSKGLGTILKRDSQLYAKWLTAHWCLSQHPSDGEALNAYPMG
jgi:hypothetical protein